MSVGLGLNIGIGLGITGGDLPAYTEAQIRSLAGVTITPGVLDIATGTTAGVAGTDFGVIAADEAGLTALNISMIVTSLADAQQMVTAGYATRTGAGTPASPYVFTINNRLWYSPSHDQYGNVTTTSALIAWTDTAADYHIRVYDCVVRPLNLANYNGFEVNCGASGKLIFDTTRLRGDNMSGVTQNFLVHTSGPIEINRCHIYEIRTPFYTKNGATATLAVNDSQFDATGAWVGGYSPFLNSTAGGSMTIRRTTFDYRDINTLLQISRDCSVTLDRVYWNSSDNANPRTVVSTSTGALLEAWTAGFTVTNSKFNAGTLIAPFGVANATTARGHRNWSFEHCEFVVTGAHLAGHRFFEIGLASNTTLGVVGNFSFRFCRFIRPSAEVAAGTELLEIFSADNVLVEGCWADSCGEDAFEMVQPLQANIIRYCGGGEVAGSIVSGNIVDMYGSGGIWNTAAGNLGGHEVHHIYGACGADAVIVDSVHGVSVHHIDVAQITDADSNPITGRTLDEVRAANVRLHARGANSFNSGNVVSVPLTAAAQSFGDYPCLLTRQAANITTVLATINSTSFTVNSATGFTIGNLIHVQLDNLINHYTTIANVVSVTITLTDAMPSVTAAGRQVDTIATYDAGACSWPLWTGSAFVTKTGTDGVVDAMVL